MEKQSSQTFLGFSSEEIAGIPIEDLYNNKTAIQMLLHYHSQINEENISLKTEVNTLNTYVKAYELKKSNSATGSILLTISNILIAFGVNLTTGSTEKTLGIICLIIGSLIIIAGIYFTFFKENK